MASLSIRRFDPALKERLRRRAAFNGRSMEAEARSILQTALETETQPTGAELVQAIRDRFVPLGGADLDLPSRGQGREPPRLDD